jgi:hypothetical protein
MSKKQTATVTDGQVHKHTRRMSASQKDSRRECRHLLGYSAVKSVRETAFGKIVSSATHWYLALLISTLKTEVLRPFETSVHGADS